MAAPRGADGAPRFCVVETGRPRRRSACRMRGKPMRTPYVCEVERADGRDEMRVRVEICAEPTEFLRREYESLLRARLGVEVRVALERPGAVAGLTGLDTRQKPIRLVEKRCR